MNREIKRVIDRLYDCEPVDEPDGLTIVAAITMLETLDNKVAEQAAVIEKLQTTLYLIRDSATGLYGDDLDRCNKALATPTDSKQILADWMREQMGEPVAWKVSNAVGVGYGDTLKRSPHGGK